MQGVKMLWSPGVKVNQSLQALWLAQSGLGNRVKHQYDFERLVKIQLPMPHHMTIRVGVWFIGCLLRMLSST
jgi:hypothetical protein